MVRISPHFGIVVKKARFAELGLDADQVLTAAEADAAFDEDETLLSLGPHFGDASASALAHKLAALGLEEHDDYFVFRGDVPEWCDLGASVATGSPDTTNPA